jgi:hypothetical protein
LTSAVCRSTSVEIGKIAPCGCASRPQPAVFVTIVRDAPCAAAIPAPRFCGTAATHGNYLPADRSAPIVTHETFRKSL